MKREEFNKLDIKKQVEAFNKMVENSSIRKVCDELKIGKTTIRNRFEKEGYNFSRDKNQYIKNDEMILKKEKVIKSNEEVIQKNDIQSNMMLTKEKAVKLEKLIEMFDDLKTIVGNCKEDVEINTKTLHVKKFKGDLYVKSIKVYKEVLEPFNKFIREHRELKQQDVINQALWEFLRKYQ